MTRLVTGRQEKNHHNFQINWDIKLVICRCYGEIEGIGDIFYYFKHQQIEKIT